MRILAGDVGGTKTSLAIFEIGRRGRTLVRKERYPSKAYPGLEQVVEIFLRGESPPARRGLRRGGPGSRRREQDHEPSLADRGRPPRAGHRHPSGRVAERL